ncbi:alpha/beta hydrolase [Psychrobacter sp.]|uniref:esterase/lipase family protein n=1 Tax=Psychrobacter sp. TaxID=56811 RepID=UPI0025EC1275|nr:alpha/beta hydrolase [Psychrobacter sp.]
MHNNLKLLKLTSCIAIASSLLITASCSTVSVDQKNSGQTIVNNRDNIVTSSRLSNKSSSLLISMGMPADECLNDFDKCLNRVDKGFINKNSKEHLALLAEIHMAKAKSIADSESCVKRIDRPPIDPYYTNAPKTAQQRSEFFNYLKQCNTAYRDNLLNAIKNSYGYLFYAQLNPNTQSDSEVPTKPNNLPTNLDIQTQDIYNTASDALIKQLYDLKDDTNQSSKITSYISPQLVSDSSSSKANELDQANTIQANTINGIKNGDLVKVLNFTFPPIDQNDYLQSNKTSKNEAATTEVQKKALELQTTILNKNADTSIDIYLPNDPEYLQNTKTHNNSIDKLYASHDLSFSGLNTISEREGVGISYVTLLDNRLDTSIKTLIGTANKQLNSKNPVDRIHQTGNLLLTGVVLPEGDTLKDVLASNKYDIKLYNPHYTETIDILGKPFYLAANFSASYGMWLAENQLDNVGYFSLLAKQQSLVLPQLFMLEPYDPNKRIIIMLHGLASSPATWISITNDISNDKELRDNYQVWQIFYPTNIPILENRYRIQELIETAYKINDPNSQHIASHDSVLIGHSMGAVIGRMLVSNENLRDNFNRLSQEENTVRLSKLVNDQLGKENLLNRLQLKKLKSVDTAVFISAPFRGTDFADRWFTQLLRRVIHLPLGFIQTITGNLASIATEGELASNPLGALYFQNGASQLSDKSSFMKLTADLKIADDVTYHSIIANRDSDLYQGLLRLKLTTTPDTVLADQASPQILKAGISSTNLGGTTEDNSAESSKSGKNNADTNNNAADKIADITDDMAQVVSPATLSDGIVPYKSSHLEGAASETIIKGGHGIQDTPEAVLTLRKILHQHLKQHPIDKKQQ